MNFDPNATDENGYCAYAEDLNCADEAACNYQPFAGPAYCLQIEPYAEHSGMIGSDDLTGYTTYRIYALCENVDDFVSAFRAIRIPHPYSIHDVVLPKRFWWLNRIRPKRCLVRILPECCV